MQLDANTFRLTVLRFSLVVTLALIISNIAFAQQWTPRKSSSMTATANPTLTTMNFSDMPALDRNGAPHNLDQQFSQSGATTQRSHLVSLNPASEIQGRIADITIDHAGHGRTSLSIYFVRNGAVAYQTQTGPDGSFTVKDVADGPYSFVATGPSGFVTYGVFVTRSKNQELTNVMEAATVSQDIRGIENILAENLPQQVIEKIMLERAKTPAQPQHAAGANQVRLINGQLTGQIFTLQSAHASTEGTMVYLIQNGSRVAEVQVDEHGNYSIPDLRPGVYDFIAVGHQGLAAIRFEAVGQDSPMTQVAFRRAPKLVATSLDVCLTCQQDSNRINRTENKTMSQASPQAIGSVQHDIEYASQSVGFGGAAGGSVGGAEKFPGYSNAYTAVRNYRGVTNRGEPQ